MTSKRTTDQTTEPTPEAEAEAEAEAPQFAPPYLGKIVYVALVDPSEGRSRYDDGSYLVIDETSGELFAVKLGELDAYKFHHVKSIPLVGAAAYQVLAVDDPTARTLAMLDGVIDEAYSALTGTRTPHWNPNVYESAYRRARDIRHQIANDLGLPPNSAEPTFPAPAKPTVVKTPAGNAGVDRAALEAETSTLLAPLVELLKPVTLSGASAELHIVFPAATSAEQKAAAERAASSRRLGEAIIATSLHPDNR